MANSQRAKGPALKVEDFLTWRKTPARPQTPEEMRAVLSRASKEDT